MTFDVNQSQEESICCDADIWGSNCSIRNLITSAATSRDTTKMFWLSSSQATAIQNNANTTNLISSSSASSLCPSLSGTKQSQSSSSQGTPLSLHCPVHNKKPIKSAMKRSSGKVPSNPKQCIPSGLSGGSIVMPTGGGIQQYHQQQQQQQPLHHQQQPSSANPTGYYSPQYGWYISMTPPTPPKYAYVDTPSSTVENKDGRQTKNEISQQKQQDPKQQILRPSHQVPSRPVFTRNLKGIPNNTSGWPSVPL
jgi:hypothetical protein